GPALAESEILAEIGAVGRIDHALEQRETILASGELIERMLALELQRRIGGMRTHPLQHMTADHQETGAGIADPGKAVDDPDMIRVVELENIVQRGRRRVCTA